MKKSLLIITMKPSILVGGQAVIEGVMMRVPGSYATAVRDPNGKIHIQKEDFTSITESSSFWRRPIFRGMASLYESMKMGMKTLNYSADIAMPDEEPQSKFAELFSTIFAISLAVFLFMIAPMWMTTKVMDLEKEAFWFNLVSGGFRIAFFILYLVIISMIGIGLCASSAATINQIIDRNIDANMARTSNRPLPQGDITTFNASLFAFALMIAGTAIRVSQVNTLTAVLTVASLIGYAFIYTVFLKRATPQNIVIGGLAGAAPPLLGWTSVTNSIDPNALLLVLIIFVWTPPHFWALAIYRKDDYARESIPMLPVTHGVRFTKLQIILYTVLLLLVSLLPFIVLMSGNIYLFSALGLGLFYLYLSLIHISEPTRPR